MFIYNIVKYCTRGNTRYYSIIIILHYYKLGKHAKGKFCKIEIYHK